MELKSSHVSEAVSSSVLRPSRYMAEGHGEQARLDKLNKKLGLQEPYEPKHHEPGSSQTLTDTSCLRRTQIKHTSLPRLLYRPQAISALPHHLYRIRKRITFQSKGHRFQVQFGHCRTRRNHAPHHRPLSSAHRNCHHCVQRRC